LDLEMSGNMLYCILLCLAGLKNGHAFQVAGDCSALLEARSSWQGGDSWDLRAATMGSPDWTLLIEFDRPLQGLEVYNGVMETADMKEFKITPEKYLKYHQAPVDVNFLVNYEASHPPAKLQYINVNGKTHYCKEGLGELPGKPRNARLGPQPRTDQLTVPFEKIIADGDKEHFGEAAEFKSSISCTAATPSVCTRTSSIIFKKQEANCPPDVFPETCALLAAPGETGCSAPTQRRDFMRKNCFTTCWCNPDTTT